MCGRGLLRCFRRQKRRFGGAAAATAVRATLTVQHTLPANKKACKSSSL